ncbi:MAG: phosphoribosyltransferase [Novosphingobium sp.]
MAEKLYLTADRLLEDSFALANRVLDSGFRPTHIVGIWRGGAPVGIAVQELLAYRGIETDHIAIRTASYSGIDQQDKEVRVYALGYLIDVLDPEDRLLVIDDVFDTGRSVEAFLKELKARCRHNTPNTIKVATAYYKPSRNQTSLKPDFFVHQTEEWLVFPHEICGLSEDEIRAHKSGAEQILRNMSAPEGNGT